MIIDIRLQDRAVTVDLDALTPKARALAEAIADTPGRHNGDIWMEADATIAETTPGWQMWFTAAEAALPERRPWRGWDKRPHTDPVAYLETEAAKIPAGWHVYGGHPHRAVASLAAGAAVREAAGVAAVCAYLRAHPQGRDITPATWTSYVGRDQAPRPVRHVSRTPVWSLDDIDAWLARPRANSA